MKRKNWLIAILLTLLMIVTAVPFSAFALTDAQKTCKHDWRTKDFSEANLAAPANCKSAATYYLICTKCGICAREVQGAEDKVIADPTGRPDPDAHPAEKLKVTKEAVAPTCTASGQTAEKTCTLCGKVAEEAKLTPIDPNAHIASDGTTANCTTAINCINCGKTIAKDPNNHPMYKVLIVEEGVAATCSEAGVTDTLFCIACEKTVDEGTVIPALGHDWKLKEIIFTACEVEGKKVCECSRCHVTEDRDKTPAREHDWSEWTVIKQPKDCIEAGEKQRTCSLCRKEESVVIPAGDHTPGSWSVEREVTCVESGLRVLRCTVCSNIICTESIPARGHTFGKWKTVTVATAEETGIQARFCATCGAFELREVNEDGSPVVPGGEIIIDPPEDGDEPTTDPANPTTNPTDEPTGEDSAPQNIFQRIGLWFRDLFNKLFGFFRR